MSSKNLIARLLERAVNRSTDPVVPQRVSEDTSPGANIQHSQQGATATPVGPISPADSNIVKSGTFLVEQDPNEPPLICWKHKLYRQKIVDGGLEPYGPPVGDC